ncbi:hypothetical protein B0H19DRAFT_1060365 [Mycena capillaripes]|nr:hypothetical protein B0H19DRAFT_1060365 [Mycena capillaripes]
MAKLRSNLCSVASIQGQPIVQAGYHSSGRRESTAQRNAAAGPSILGSRPVKTKGRPRKKRLTAAHENVPAAKRVRLAGTEDDGGGDGHGRLNNAVIFIEQDNLESKLKEDIKARAVAAEEAATAAKKLEQAILDPPLGEKPNALEGSSRQIRKCLTWLHELLTAARKGTGDHKILPPGDGEFEGVTAFTSATNNGTMLFEFSRFIKLAKNVSGTWLNDGSAHIPDTSAAVGDGIGLVRAIAVKGCSSSKLKDLFKRIQLRHQVDPNEIAKQNQTITTLTTIWTLKLQFIHYLQMMLIGQIEGR